MKNEYTFLDKAIETGSLLFASNSNSPFFCFLNIVEIREKSIKLNHEFINLPVWLPKKGIKFIAKSNACTLALWYRQVILKDGNTYVFRALNM